MTPARGTTTGPAPGPGEYAGPVPERLPAPSPEHAAALADRLGHAGVRVVRGTYVDSSGVIRAKQVPVERLGAFAVPGLGAAPSWAVFCVDDAIAFTPSIGPVGDMRLRLDLEALRATGPAHAWAPVELFDQEGEPLRICPRAALRRQQAALEGLGVSVRAAFEVEFVCFHAESGEVADGVAYGLRPLLEREAFLDDLTASFEAADLSLEQLHAEYGAGQFELSVAPASPLAAADANVAARLLISAAARRHGLLASFSPQALAEGIGNGAHVHLSFERGAEPLLSGGDGPHGLSAEGGSIVAGLIAGLPDAIAVLAPSLLSGYRLQPGHWAGAFSCWGLENREAAMRLCAATAGNPHGAHLEVKCVDPSANPYVALATLLGFVRSGLESGAAAPEAVALDPQRLSDEERSARGVVALGRDQAALLDALEASPAMAAILGPELVEVLLAVRRHEVELAKGAAREELLERFRFAWSG